MVRAIGKDLNEQMRTLVSQFDAVYSGIIQSLPRYILLLKINSVYSVYLRSIIYQRIFSSCLSWRNCIDDVVNVLNFAVGYAYVKQHFDEETKIMVSVSIIGASVNSKVCILLT